MMRQVLKSRKINYSFDIKIHSYFFMMLTDTIANLLYYQPIKYIWVKYLVGN
jgi:hypothetical protein